MVLLPRCCTLKGASPSASPLHSQGLHYKKVKVEGSTDAGTEQEGTDVSVNTPNPETCARLCEDDNLCAAAFFDQSTNDLLKDQTGQCYFFSLRSASFVGTTSDTTCKQKKDVCYVKTGPGNQKPKICTGAHAIVVQY